MTYFLLALLTAPAIAAGLLLLLAPPPAAVRWVALAGALATLVAALSLAGSYYADVASQPAEEAGAVAPIDAKILLRHNWLTINRPTAQQPYAIDIELGVDGVSVAMILLTSLVWVSCVLAAWDTVEARQTEYFAALMLLESGLLGVFCAFDLVSFYVCFELTLIPLFFLVGVFGGARRRVAGLKFLIMALAGSLATLLGLAVLVAQVASEGLGRPCSLVALGQWLQQHPLDSGLQTTLLLLISGGLVVKTPLFPLHTWMPLFHEQTPRSGSVDMAAVLLKLGAYGFFRLCLPLLPTACANVGTPLFVTLALVGIVYGSLCALAQKDIKAMVAYSGLAHMGFAVLGLFALNEQGIAGGLLQVVNSGLATAGLFLLIGAIERRYGTRQAGQLGGLAGRLPVLGALMVTLAMASIGLPGLNGFVSEVLALAGMLKAHPVYAAVGASGLVLGAWYLLTMLQQVLFGADLRAGVAVTQQGARERDLNLRELLAVCPIVLACLWLGIRPQPAIESIRPAVARVAGLYPDAPAPEKLALVAAGPID